MAGKKARKRIKRQNGKWVHAAAHVSLPPSPWDHGAAGPANRMGLVEEERGEVDTKTGRVINPNRVTGVRRHDMLEVYYKRGWISMRGYTAGQALREAWERTEMGTCAPWLRDRVDSSPKPDAAIAIQIDRMTQLMRISRLIARGDDPLLHAVVARGIGLAHVKAYRGGNHDKGKQHLHDALEQLADRIEGRKS
ncbi:MAG: hypothetical protein Q4G49_10870 [Paracoccus sp. (in: a-proteobacteria)]|nr:hypothetical protein [Paracoccus sp. (in: a-proteobacteria)]